MLSHRSEGLAKLLIVCQLGIATVVFYFCSFVTYNFLTTEVASFETEFWIYVAVILVGLLGEGFTRHTDGMRVRLRDRNPIVLHPVALRQTLFAAGALLAYLAAVKDADLARTVLALFFPSLYLALMISGYFLPRLLARHIFVGIREERTLVIGSPERLAQLHTWLESKAAMGFRTLGLLCDEEMPAVEPGQIRRLGGIAEIEQVVGRYKPTQLLLLQLPEQLSRHRDLIAVADAYGLRVLILNTLPETLEHPVVHFEDEGRHFVALRREPLENPFNRVLKRLLDIAVALPMILFVLPVLCLGVWLFQRLQSRGPLFFMQERAGFQNDRFYLMKFRTMHVANDDAARQASKGDGRVYPAGRWLRKLSLDEIPQFWNVLIGEMSVVGPRPHMIEHNALFARQLKGYHARNFVKPGITGLAQVRGFRGEIRSNADLSNRLRSDLFYLESWTLGTDLLVIARTAWQLLRPPATAY